MTSPHINRPTAAHLGCGLREQGKERTFPENRLTWCGAGRLINNYAPRQQLRQNQEKST